MLVEGVGDEVSELFLIDTALDFGRSSLRLHPPLLGRRIVAPHVSPCHASVFYRFNKLGGQGPWLGLSASSSRDVMYARLV